MRADWMPTLVVTASLADQKNDEFFLADANCGMTVENTLRLLRLLPSHLDFVLESPCATWHETISLRRRTGFPIIFDELVTDTASLVQLIAEDGAEGINLKIAKCGGLTKGRRIRDICLAAGYTMTVQDAWGSDISFAAIVHLAQTIPERNLRCILDVRDCSTVKVARCEYGLHDGNVTASREPGLGITPHLDVLGKPVASYYTARVNPMAPRSAALTGLYSHDESPNSRSKRHFYRLGGATRDTKWVKKKRACEEKPREVIDDDIHRGERAHGQEEIRFDSFGHRRMHRHDRPASGGDVANPRPSVVSIDTSESHAPQYCQASTHQAPKAHATADQESVTAVVISEPSFPPSSERSEIISPSKDKALPHRGARGTDRDSDGTILVDVDSSEPFIPAPTMKTSCQPPATPVRDKARRSGMILDRSTQNRISIASSFASNVSLSNLRAPSGSLSLFPDPLRTPNRRPPTVAERSINRLPRLHPMPTIYGAYRKPDTHTAGQYTDVRPPRTSTDRHIPAGQNAHGQDNVSLPSSPESDVFEISPSATPAVRSRPVTTWGAWYDKPALPS
ncbi:uncharacterized protein N0V89_000713 [Didymosphaeria variabile]|uniref:Enolase C-terminal domain-containing protein n=1 Tax=Didymosphaeria variabile TaxID=1932322 RepID=A0A9W9CF72_9PLEO|nr:uncharacterized protein N0V89_000713 [Didymosphaeria variabile]KAJ4360153.1 hypothetical protein N0V89_000713 [Didymosphaeria variabile]